VENVTTEDEALHKIQSTSYDIYYSEAKAWQNRVLEHTKQRRFKQTPNEYLNMIETKWRQHN